MDALLGLAAMAYLTAPLWALMAAIYLTAIKEKPRAASALCLAVAAAQYCTDRWYFGDVNWIAIAILLTFGAALRWPEHTYDLTAAVIRKINPRRIAGWFIELSPDPKTKENPS